VLRIARTLADFNEAERVGRLHLAEALPYPALAEGAAQAA
jgi:magnesium chelatase family protein